MVFAADASATEASYHVIVPPSNAPSVDEVIVTLSESAAADPTHAAAASVR